MFHCHKKRGAGALLVSTAWLKFCCRGPELCGSELCVCIVTLKSMAIKRASKRMNWMVSSLHACQRQRTIVFRCTVRAFCFLWLHTVRTYLAAVTNFSPARGLKSRSWALSACVKTNLSTWAISFSTVPWHSYLQIPQNECVGNEPRRYNITNAFIEFRHNS